MPNALALPSPSGTLTTAPGFTLPAVLAADEARQLLDRGLSRYTCNFRT